MSILLLLVGLLYLFFMYRQHFTILGSIYMLRRNIFLHRQQFLTHARTTHAGDDNAAA